MRFWLFLSAYGLLVLLLLEFIRRRVVEKADPSATLSGTTQFVDRRTMWLSSAAIGLIAIQMMLPKASSIVILVLFAAGLAVSFFNVLHGARSNGVDKPVRVAFTTIGIVLLGVAIAAAASLAFVVANLFFLHLPTWLFKPLLAVIMGVPLVVSMLWCLRINRQGPLDSRDHSRP